MLVLGTGVVMSLQNKVHPAAFLEDLSHLGGVFQAVVFPDVGIDILVEADDGLAGNSGKTGAEGFGIGKRRVRPVVAAFRMIGISVGGEAGIEKEERLISQGQVARAVGLAEDPVEFLLRKTEAVVISAEDEDGALRPIQHGGYRAKILHLEGMGILSVDEISETEHKIAAGIAEVRKGCRDFF